ncbi:MAG: MFS transporter [Pseudomonadota bacterium]
MIKKNINPWIICIISASCFFYAFAQLNLINSLSDALITEWHLSKYQLENLSSCYLYAVAIAFFPCGYLLDKFSVRKLLTIAIFFSGVLTLGFALAQNYQTAVMIRLSLGGLHALIFLGCLRIAVKSVPENRSALAVGLSITIGLLGGLFVQVCFPFALLFMSWRYLMLIFSSIGFFIWVLNFKYTNIALLNENKQVSERFFSWFLALLKVVSCFQNWLYAIYICLMNLPMMILGALWGDWYLKTHENVTNLQASIIISMIYLGMILGSPAVGWLADTLNRRKLLMLIGAVVSLMIIMVINYVKVLDVSYLILLFLTLGILASVQNLGYVLIAKNNAKNLSSTATSFAAVIIMLGSALLQLIFTLSIKTYPNQFGFNLTNLELLIISFAISTSIALCVKD